MPSNSVILEDHGLLHAVFFRRHVRFRGYSHCPGLTFSRNLYIMYEVLIISLEFSIHDSFPAKRQ